jgi:methylmalonyl-CoA/ethylmalonyl-CoA epimerase
MIKIHHVSIVVNSIEQALPAFTAGLGLELERIKEVPQQRVRVAFLPTAAAEVELTQPTDDTSGVAKFLASHGEGMHHICFQVDDIAASLRDLAASGAELIDKEPRQGVAGLVAFVHPKSMHGVLVELLQKQ